MVSEDAFRTFLELMKTGFDSLKSQIATINEELNELRYEVMVKGAMKEPKTLLIPNNSIKPNLLPQISTGNEGVQTHRHTDTQTDNTPLFPLDGKPLNNEKTPTHPTPETSTHLRHIPEKLRHFDTFLDTSTHNQTHNQENQTQKAKISDLNKLMESLKEDLKKKFQSLTKQEFYIFSVLFTLDKTQNQVTYQDLATRTGLTSSSIRDYVRRIIQKGIPLIKDKVNNKLTVLKIPLELRNLATLDNLIRIRGIPKDSDLDRFAAK